MCFGCREGRTRCCCMACSSTAPLLRSDCDPSLWVCGQVCVVSFLCTDANTLAPLLFALPSQMQTLEILPLVYLACLFLFPSLSPAISLSLSLDSPLISLLFPFYASPLTLRSIQFSAGSLAADLRGAAGFLKLRRRTF